MNNTPVGLDQIEIPRTPVDIEVVKKYSKETQFMGLAVELLKEVSTITTLLSCTYHLDDSKRPRQWTRNEAILAGLLVRISKLQRGYLDQTCQNRGEIANLIYRPLMETLINLRFLLTQESDNIRDEYIEYSLREEKKLLQTIEQNIQNRGGKSLSIEERMIKSIKRAFEKSKLTPEQVNEKNTSAWGGNIYKRAKAVNMQDAYSAIIGLPSHVVHGNWQDLITHHLTYDEGSFTPNPDWTPCRPQSPFSVAHVSVIVDLLYLDKALPIYHETEEIRHRLNDLVVRISVADEMHEGYLQRKKSPKSRR